jgi:hypothetical protein
MTTRELLDNATGDDVAVVTLTASTGKGEAKNKTEFPANLPKTLHAGIRILGEKKVHRLFINALVVELQGDERSALAPKGEKKERKKAAYLETLGL